MKPKKQYLLLGALALLVYTLMQYTAIEYSWMKWFMLILSATFLISGFAHKKQTKK